MYDNLEIRRKHVQALVIPILRRVQTNTYISPDNVRILCYTATSSMQKHMLNLHTKNAQILVILFVYCIRQVSVELHSIYDVGYH